MPTYEFKCSHCGAREEFQVNMRVIELSYYFFFFFFFFFFKLKKK